MKFLVLASRVLVFVASCTLVVGDGDRTITKVVKLLQGMLEKSQAEGEEERTIYAKFKCYCDQSEAEKRASIKQLTTQISLLENQIAEVQGDTGELSSECANLKASMAENEASRDEATAIREKENKAFLEEEADLDEAIKDAKAAIEELTKVGADQTDSSGAADHKKFMAGYGEKKSLLSLRAALKAARSLMTDKQREGITAFIQAPFTGTYTSQSAEVVGILKDMRDTFTANLETARTNEKKAKEAYGKFMKLKEAAFKSMEENYETKQKELGDNDGELSAKKMQLAEAEKQKASDEEFLEKLLPLCEDKAKGYQARKLSRANEEAAIAEAISILNSDASFETFGTVDATSAGKAKAAASFMQLRSVRQHEAQGHMLEQGTRIVIDQLLQKALKDSKSSRVAKILALVKAENPFETVLVEIEKMIGLIGEEAKADKANLDWCNKERDENEASLAEKISQITALNSRIDKLTITIEDPKTGLKKQIADTELSLVENKESQTTETAERTKDNLSYQADIKNLQDAEHILTKAIKVLNAYYDELSAKLAKGEELKLMQEDPSAPEAWKGDGAYAGQSKQGGDVIKMLEYILSETVKEETTAHSEEEKSQADYEDSMTKLKKEEAEAEKSLANLRETLAEKEQELIEANEDLKATTKDKEAIEAYLEKIKPGCDFITTNFDTREANRKTEKDALEKAVTLIKDTPAYKTSVNEATVESYGTCKKPCVADKEDVKCKACMADVTIPAYCAGHEGTKGC